MTPISIDHGNNCTKGNYVGSRTLESNLEQTNLGFSMDQNVNIKFFLQFDNLADLFLHSIDVSILRDPVRNRICIRFEQPK